MIKIIIVMCVVLACVEPCQAARRFRFGRVPCGRSVVAVKHATGSASAPKKALPEIAAIRWEWQDIEGIWMPYAENEAIWVDFPQRQTCVLEPSDYSQVRLIRFLKQPSDDPNAAWVEFGRAENGLAWSLGNLGNGNWLVGAEVHFSDGTIRTNAKR